MNSPLRGLVESMREPNERVRVRWKTVASLLKLPFVAGICDDWFRKRLNDGSWPRFISGPDEGRLEDSDYLELVKIFSEESVDQKCYFRLAEIPYIAMDAPLLFEGQIKEVLSISASGQWKRPEYWWPENQTWCMCSDYDLSSTLIGGSRRLIDRVLASCLLEAIEVSAQQRVDYLTPIASA